ncbi:hypothetical protein AA18895_0370 [Acetobacter ghanensis DSM 18895]|nr:hypothetical protein AA18895_0370 [Acetobacter ghanensis DSM 18895]
MAGETSHPQIEAYGANTNTPRTGGMRQHTRPKKDSTVVAPHNKERPTSQRQDERHRFRVLSGPAVFLAE